jgi:hypothetical protein
MCVLTKYDQIEPIYLQQSVVTYISLHSVYMYECTYALYVCMLVWLCSA